MIKKHYTEVPEEEVTMANSIKTTIRWLITKEDGAKRYTTRRFEIQPGFVPDTNTPLVGKEPGFLAQKNPSADGF